MTPIMDVEIYSSTLSIVSTCRSGCVSDAVHKRLTQVVVNSFGETQRPGVAGKLDRGAPSLLNTTRFATNRVDVAI
jgi:hypothetical protein